MFDDSFRPLSKIGDDMILEGLHSIIHTALHEDVGQGDVTSQLTIPEDHVSEFKLVAREPMVLSGVDVAAQVCATVDDALMVNAAKSDGMLCEAGEVIATVRGNTRSILTAERTALNLMQRMSGIATETQRYVAAVKDTKAIILDTRKTAPGLRVLDKYAVTCGGGQNHRMRLDDAILIKDNHIAAAGSLVAALQAAKAAKPEGLLLEVECDTLAQAREAVEHGAERILLDNMSLEQLRKAVEWYGESVALEASGGVTLGTVHSIAETGVHYISVGALTHSVRASDIGLDEV